ncbi:MAG: two-component system response regulator [Nitrospinae bacterium CG11_big_fil_rev_8_21_14_0_20_56_8]|nr:MAG: two-component system response regulator [Nitrospinae bacterium CG11_big_fil_rev_8_21_14_0_20_56_8]
MDDEVEFCSLTEEFLRDQYTVKVAYNGKEALRQIQEFKPDCLLLDLRMPELNGKEVLKFLQTYHSSVKTLVITASGNLETARECLEMGALDYILKPIELNELSDKIRSALER